MLSAPPSGTRCLHRTGDHDPEERAEQRSPARPDLPHYDENGCLEASRCGSHRSVCLGVRSLRWARQQQRQNSLFRARGCKAAKALKVGRTTAAKAFELLQETGLLALETKGTFNRKVRHASEWRLTELQSDVTSDWATRDYLNWRPGKIQNTGLQDGLTGFPGGPSGPSRRTEAA
jgi:hypothetical protein